MIYTNLKSVKVGDLFKLTPNGRIYVRNTYNCDSKKFEYYDYDNIGRYHEAKGTKKVIINFD